MKPARKNGILFLAAGLTVACALIASAQWREREPVRIPVDLNATLTNALSDTAVLSGLDKQVRAYMQEWNLKGASLCIMRHDSLLYAKGYGMADKDVPMSPATLLRVASVSKLITATGIMLLQECGMLTLDDRVFAPGGALEEFSDIIRDTRLYDVTIRHLLMHEAGFTSRAGDPMFSTRTLMKQNKWQKPPDSETLVRSILKRDLYFDPGTASEYSNFGYLLLSLVIERITGEAYEDWMRENVLKAANCTDMHLAYNYYKDKYPGETRYYLQSNDKAVERYDNSGIMVPRCYGGNDIRALKGAGAWVTSVPELARFVASIDGQDEVPDILSRESIEAMTFPTDSVTYGLGWNDISEEGVWTRTGTFSGTSALIKNYPDGECWIMVTNTSTWRGPHFTKWTSSLFTRLREQYSSVLPARDFFYRPED
ncbi:MAG: beta-lactamase family protein [Bacteroidales bacterium]|nr:beta-lactamase family protein [Bacteroidales bacterium]